MDSNGLAVVIIEIVNNISVKLNSAFLNKILFHLKDFMFIYHSNSRSKQNSKFPTEIFNSIYHMHTNGRRFHEWKKEMETGV